MRNTLIFAGSSCPSLTSQICENLGMTPAPADLSQFSNGETSVRILKSVREKDVFVVQSGSSRINDTVMELLVMIAALKGGSATKITAVLPYLPYSRQSKKKSHRGAITARLLANLLGVAGVKHIITVDLHASQMQGFFKCPIDNLHAESLLARWIRQHVPGWQDGVVVSKNAGGTKRATSLADALKLSFGMITTDRRRGTGLAFRTSLSTSSNIEHSLHITASRTRSPGAGLSVQPLDMNSAEPMDSGQSLDHDTAPSDSLSNSLMISQPSTPKRSFTNGKQERRDHDHQVREITRGRLIQGHIVDDNYPIPNPATTTYNANDDDPMVMSHASSFFAAEGASLGGSDDAGDASDEEEDVLQDPTIEHMITIVGNVKNRPVFILDDMIDKPQSWIAAAETVVKRALARKVYCMATHGVFGGNCLQQLDACEFIDAIVVTNSFPISEEQALSSDKLVVLDLSTLLAEAIRRNHHGESISALFQHMPD